MIRLRGLLRCQKGSSGTEMVLMLPFLVVLLFGAIEVGYYFYNQHMVIKGVRDGARYAGRQSFEDINCAGSTVPASVTTAIKEVTRTGRTSGGTARVPGWDNADITVSYSCAGDGGGTAVTTGIYANEPDAPIVTVSATVTYNSLFGSLGIVDSTYSLNASQQSAVMGI